MAEAAALSYLVAERLGDFAAAVFEHAERVVPADVFEWDVRMRLETVGQMTPRRVVELQVRDPGGGRAARMVWYDDLIRNEGELRWPTLIEDGIGRVRAKLGA